MFGTESPLSTREDDGTTFIHSEEVDKYYAFRLKMEQANVRSKGKCPECFSRMEGEFWECSSCREDAQFEQARSDEDAYCKGLAVGVSITCVFCSALWAVLSQLQ